MCFEGVIEMTKKQKFVAMAILLALMGLQIYFFGWPFNGEVTEAELVEQVWKSGCGFDSQRLHLFTLFAYIK